MVDGAQPGIRLFFMRCENSALYDGVRRIAGHMPIGTADASALEIPVEEQIQHLLTEADIGQIY